jgi:hypothetical protein
VYNESEKKEVRITLTYSLTVRPDRRGDFASRLSLLRGLNTSHVPLLEIARSWFDNA